jgi:archaea-specific RecJ-like exonuclease
MVQLQNIEQIEQTAFEEEVSYEVAGVVKNIYTTPTGFSIIKITDGKDFFSFTTADQDLLKNSNLKENCVALFSFKKTIYNGELQGKLLDVRECSGDLCKELELLVNKKRMQQETKYEPKQKTLLCNTSNFQKLLPSLLEIATIIRKAVFEKRPIIISHHADADGYCAGFLLEQAITELIASLHKDIRYIGDYIQRNPSKTPYYDVSDATKDINFFLSKNERNKLANPLLVIVDNGSTPQDLFSIRKVKTFGFDVVVIDHHDPGILDEKNESLICKEVLAHVNPHLHTLGHSLSASLLSFELSRLVNKKSILLVFLAAVGGVADKCEGEEIDFFIKSSKQNREELEELALIVDFEIFQTKFNHAKTTLHELLLGSKTIQEELVVLYRPVLEEYTHENELVVQQYLKQERLGNFTLFSLDGEQTTQWGDYFTLRKLAAIANKLHEDVVPRVILVHSEQVFVFRAEKGTFSFDVNVLVAELKEKFPYARVSGGGHDVAGSIKCLPIAKSEVLSYVKLYIEKQM